MTEYVRPWWDLRAACIVWRRVRGMVVKDFVSYKREPWWSIRAATTATRIWWRMGHGRRMVS